MHKHLCLVVYKHHCSFKYIILFLIAIYLNIACYNNAYCATADSRTDRSKVATSKAKKTSKNKKIYRSLTVAGSYNSDYNSKNYRLLLRGYYQDFGKIFQLDFSHYSNWQDTGTGKKKVFLAKTSELYDLQLISKLIIGNSKYYLAGYERVNYDDLSNYYYDHRQALGMGIFLDQDQIELDLSFGRYQIKDTTTADFIVPSLRMNYKISKKIRVSTRNYLFLNHNSFDFQNRSSVKYYLTKNFALELIYNFDKVSSGLGQDQTNRVERFVQFGTNVNF